MKILSLVLGSLVLLSTPALADPCDKPKPKKVLRKKVQKKTVIPLPRKADCDCPPGKPGKDGRDGKEGKPGKNGRNGTTAIVMVEKPGLSLKLGLMAAAYARDGDWAWGPALMLSQPVGKRGELAFQAGFAGPIDRLSWSPGRESGYLLRVGYTRFKKDDPKVGLTMGVSSTSIAGSSSNGNVDADYLGLDVGAVVRTGRYRFQFGPMLATNRDDDLSVGLSGSFFARL